MNLFLKKSNTDIAELVLDHQSVQVEPFMVNSKDFKIDLDYTLVESDKEWYNN